MTRTPPAVAPPAAESGGESLLTVLIALGVNTVIAVVKSIVGAVPGSAPVPPQTWHAVSTSTGTRTWPIQGVASSGSATRALKWGVGIRGYGDRL